MDGRNAGISAEAHDMTTFTVWKFDDPQGAVRTVRMLEDAQASGLVKIDDHAIVSWPAGAAQAEPACCRSTGPASGDRETCPAMTRGTRDGYSWLIPSMTTVNASRRT